mmetsp:Transcript_9815/g.19325  ORF Transcript_9815/g.19325 Transcript_9815/m.19325 type:complete len:318 (-) Transcript_9815:203-1156(-)
MEEYLTCAVSLELFDSKERLPLILTCGHSLCKSCIQNIRQAQGFIMCPIDRTTENKPIESLITNLALLQLVDVSRFTDYPRCPQHPSKKLRYYCHNPCGQPFCSKCLMAHSCHSCIDPEDAKSLEALLMYIESECIKLSSESDHNSALVSDYNRQLNQLSERRLKLECEVRESFDKLRAQLSARERQTLNDIECKALEIQSLIEESQKSASEQIHTTGSVLKEVLEIQEHLKTCMPQERLKQVVKLHNLLSNRMVSFSVSEDYLRRLPLKMKPPIKKLFQDRAFLKSSKKSMIIEEEPDLKFAKKFKATGCSSESSY